MKELIAIACACIIGVTGWHAYAEYKEHQRSLVYAENDRHRRFSEGCRAALKERRGDKPEFKADVVVRLAASDARLIGCS